MSIGSELRQVKHPDTAFDRRGPRLPYEAVPYALSTADAFIILSASLLSGLFYHWATRTQLPDLAAYVALGLIASFVHILRLGGRGYYDFEQAAKAGVEIGEVVLCWVSTALLLAFFAFLLKVGDAFSRGSFLIFMVIAPVGLLVGRKIEKRFLRSAAARGSIGKRNSVLLGDPDEIAKLEKWDVLTLCGSGDLNRFLLKSSERSSSCSLDERTFENVADFVRENNSSEILLAVPWRNTELIELVRERSKTLPVSVKLLPDSQIRNLTNYSSSAGQRQLSIEIQRAPLNAAERVVKRLIDVVGSFCALVFFAPIMLLTCVAIKLDGPGPIIFRQKRKGFNGNQFTMFKFRTMSVQENGPTVTQATRDDPRVTAIGKLLRASSIDELPQLVNVLRGDMSLIGPRPHAIAHDNYFETILSDYAFRHHVKPGMTGWAQINGLRGATPTVDLISARVKMDLWYINNWTLWLDIQIVLKTFVEVIRKRNAY
jgi:undecaprenyl-phosphate galactose phosphotransferase/putative colanic acid biosynthesis UDP-glucose lipid carrier transferase